ncbi:MAG: hypothetical protein AAF604_09910 [Acidobacteriota bacterium]
MSPSERRQAAAPGRPSKIPASPSRWIFVARLLTAIPVNYGYTALATAFAARYLPLDPGPASVAATTASFLLFANLVMVAFSIRRISRLWLFLAATGGPMALLLWLSLAAEGRL